MNITDNSTKNNVKLIAWHLPQFHEIKENNEWWGKGFTEWTNTRKAKHMFREHYQPREPMNNNYYDLLEKETMIWQAGLAEEYGVYGFCYYHYYFNGKKLLEKPLENLLEWQDIEFPFCLSWANEPWTRAWDGGNKEVLMSQNYGGENEWNNHFEYLLKFFKDRRYIQIDNKPLFLIYRTESIPNCENMIKFWDEAAKKNGFAGIYIVETLNTFQKKSVCSNSSAEVIMEPMYTIVWDINSILFRVKRKIKFLIGRIKEFTTYEYSYVWKRIINRKYDGSAKKLFLGAFVDWDNTPRKKNGVVFLKSSPVLFEKFMKKQIRNAIKINSEFIFINAWNEWAEGTYLEPDKKYGLEYLKKIKNIW